MIDLTVVFYTANYISKKFAENTYKQLLKAKGDYPIIKISQSIDTPRSHINIYKQALNGVKQAKTKYIALAEDDVLYHKDHFSYRPHDGYFAYNINTWLIYTWVNPAIFSYKGRRNLCQLICERDLFINAIEERFNHFPNEDEIPIQNFSEPGKYESKLGVRPQKSETFYSDMPNIIFSHESGLSYYGLGKRKKLGELKSIEIPYWGRAEVIKKLYE